MTLLWSVPSLPVVEPNMPLFQPITAFAPLTTTDRPSIRGCFTHNLNQAPSIQLVYGIVLNDWALSVKIQILSDNNKDLRYYSA